MRAIGFGDRRVIEPCEISNRPEQARDRPFAARRIGEQNARDVAERVVAREQAVAAVSPAIVALGAHRRYRRRDFGPPRRRIGADRIQLDAVAGGAFTAPWNVERHGRSAVQRGEDEAAIVEMHSAQGVGGARLRGVEIRIGEDGIARRFVAMPPAVGDRAADRVAEELADRRRRTRPQIDDAAPSGVPWRGAGDFDVDVILERDIGPDQREHVDARGGGRLGIVVAFFVGAQRAFVGMRARVVRGDAVDRRIGEDHRAVARGEIAAVQSLADEQR